MAQLGNDVFTGTNVKDANEVNILTGATLNAAGTTNSTAVQVDRPGDVAIVLETSTVTGTTPTLNIRIQGCDSSGFGSNVVDYGSFSLSGGSQSSNTKMLYADIYKKYVRCAVTVAGTSPVYTGSSVALRQEHWHRTASTTAAT